MMVGDNRGEGSTKTENCPRMRECRLRSFYPLSPLPCRRLPSAPLIHAERMHIRLQNRLLFPAFVGILLAQPHYGA